MNSSTPTLEAECLQLKVQLSLSNGQLYHLQQKLLMLEAKFDDMKEELSNCKMEKARLKKTVDKLSTPGVKSKIDSKREFYSIFHSQIIRMTLHSQI